LGKSDIWDSRGGGGPAGALRKRKDGEKKEGIHLNKRATYGPGESTMRRKKDCDRIRKMLGWRKGDGRCGGRVKGGVI